MEILLENLDNFVDYFYEDFFDNTPEIKKVFRNSDLLPQKIELKNGLLFILNSEDDRDVDEFLFKLGQRHVAYEVLEQHYPLVKVSLMNSLKFIFGDEYNSKLEEKLICLVDHICDQMQAGSKNIREAA